MVFTTYLFVFDFLPLVLLVYYCARRRESRHGACWWDKKPRAQRLPASRQLHFLWLVEPVVHLLDARRHGGQLPVRPDYRPAGGKPSASDVGRHHRDRSQFEYARLLQVRGVLSDQLESRLGITRRRHSQGTPDHAADGHLVLHISCDQLQRGCLSRQGPAREIIRRFRLLYRAISPVGRRSHHPLQHGGRSARLPGHTWEKFSSGVALFSLGFAKKVLLANPIGQVATAAFDAQALSTLDAWLGAIAYAFQIYFDFCGYSDMAVGLGRMLGFEFMKNFDAPYRADSITDFWRRWHISLSTFLRDYLYIPLGGNRHGSIRTYINLIVVMLLGGLWHGANWTFVAWGAFHGVLLAYERFRGKQSLYHALPHLVQVGATFVLVLFSWVLFRSTSFHEATSYLGAMFGHGGADPSVVFLSAQLYTREALFTLAACAAFTVWPIQAHDWSRTITWPKALVVHPLFGLSLLAMFSQSFNPFLYFQF